MRVLNLVWGFGIGGVGKCFLVYSQLGAVEPLLEIRSVCIYPSDSCDNLEVLRERGIDVLQTRSRLDFSWIRRLGAIMREWKPDAVFTHGFNGPVAALAAFGWCGVKVPLLCSYHSAYIPMSALRKPLAPIFNGVMYWVYANVANGVLGVSRFTVEELRRCGIPDAKLAFVYNGIADVPPDLSGPADFPLPKPHTVTFAAVSRLDEAKGVAYLIEAVARARESAPNVRLVILGDGPELPRLKEQVSRLELGAAVAFLGARSDVANCLSCVDAYCLPSLSETFSISLVEAMRAGKPSIASAVGGVLEVATESEALLVPPRDVGALANAIAKLARDGGLRERMGRSARRRYLDNFTEEKMMAGVAKWLLGRRASAPRSGEREEGRRAAS